MQGRKRGAPRVLGPYRDERRGQWIYAVVVAGRKDWVRCRPACTEAGARRAVEKAKLGLEVPAQLTVEDAVESYVEHLEQQSGNRSTCLHATAALKPMVDLRGQRLVADLSPSDVDAFVRVNGRLRMASQETYFKVLRRLSLWLCRRGMNTQDIALVCAKRRELRDDPWPWATLAGRKQIGRGKVVLRNRAEAMAYFTQALARRTPEERVAAALPLLTGMASGELLHLRAGAIDFAGKCIWIRDDEHSEGDGEMDWNVKSASRRRSVFLPEDLEADLAVLTVDQPPSRYLFRQYKREEPRGPSWLRDLVHEVCEAAEVRIVCPHGLRATHATLLRDIEGRPGAQIGEALGHGNDHGQTARKHYIGAPERVPELRLLPGGHQGVA